MGQIGTRNGHLLVLGVAWEGGGVQRRGKEGNLAESTEQASSFPFSGHG